MPLPQVALSAVAYAAAMSVGELRSRLLAEADGPHEHRSNVLRGDCWLCGFGDVGTFAYDICPDCKKPTMEWN